MIMRNRYSLRLTMFCWGSVLLGPGISDEEMHGAQRTLHQSRSEMMHVIHSTSLQPLRHVHHDQR